MSNPPMPRGNRFRHQEYSADQPTAPYRLLTAEPRPEPESPEFRQRMRHVGDAFRRRGIDVIYLMHGTFVGGDPLGLWAGLSRRLPKWGASLHRFSKRLTDAVVGEHGNYTNKFAKLFEKSINLKSEREIPVRLFYWTSENNHIGRADAAIRLLDQLAREPHRRVMLWGHSHAGNVFALMTNLLAGDENTRREFFESAGRHFHRTLTGRVDLPHWQRVQDSLNERDGPFDNISLDIVTFGAPIRYGWETGSYRSLLHFVNHRPLPDAPEYLTLFPPAISAVLRASGGDYVQHWGIAGTNIMPPIWALRSWWADRKLSRFLNPNQPVRKLWSRLKLGMRVAGEGTTYLVDYGSPDVWVLKHLAGHAAYTERRWLLFHAETVARFLQSEFSAV